jgi:alkylation response protein AidB-like acyl-CoA dehydrogenase
VADSVLASQPAPPLTLLSEDEQLFRATVRQFAQENIAPLVRTMDEQQHFHPELIPQLFNLGLMGIEIPIEYGGSGGTFFEAILAVEEISAVDPSVGVLIDVQNTLCINAILRWGTPEQKKQFLSRLATDTVGAYALSEAGSGSDAFALQMRAEKRGDSYLPATKGSLRSWWTSAPPDFPSARRKISWAFALPPPARSSSKTVKCRRPTFWASRAKATRSPLRP